MLIPLGILASAGGVPPIVSDYELIETVTLGSTQTSVTFDVSSFASTYKHLQIRATARATSGALQSMNMRLGSPSIDSAGNYATHQLFGYNGSVGSGAAVSSTTMIVGVSAGSSQTANIFGATVIDILDIFSSTKNTTTRSLSGVGNSSTNGDIELQSGHWRNTASVQTIEILTVGSSFASDSRFSIYGIKG
jgi:hypothetical protein